MNKEQLITSISIKTEMKKSDVEKALNAFISITITTLRHGDKISISNLGTFEKIQRLERNGINPMTKEKIKIPAKKIPKFKPAKAFKDSVA